jgi:Uma2 family endonuclease
MTTVTAVTSSLSADEFLSGDYPVGSELIDGVVFVNDPGFRHQRLCLRLIRALADWADSGNGSGEVGYGGNWVLADRHVYKPDVWWIATPPEGARHDGPPDLAVEVRSPGTWHRDIGPKLRIYAEAGTRELWLVDTPARAVLVYRAGAFDDAAELGPGDALASPLLPGFALPLDELFRE